MTARRGKRGPTPRDRAELARFRRFLGGEFGPREAREYVAFSVTEVARLLGLSVAEVEAIELGGAPADPALRAKLERLYRCRVAWPEVKSA